MCAMHVNDLKLINFINKILIQEKIMYKSIHWIIKRVTIFLFIINTLEIFKFICVIMSY